MKEDRELVELPGEVLSRFSLTLQSNFQGTAQDS